MGMCLEKQKVSKMIIQRVISTPSYMTLLEGLAAQSKAEAIG